MGIQLVITIVTRGDDLEQGVPRGFQYADQVFAEAGLRDSTGEAPSVKFWQQMRILQRALKREFGDRVVLRVLDPWTLGGLWFVTRHRVRGFPCLVIAGQRYSPDTSLSELVEVVRHVLQ